MNGYDPNPDPWFTPATQQPSATRSSGTFNQWERGPQQLDNTRIPGWAAAAYARRNGDGCNGETCSEKRHKAEHTPAARSAYAKRAADTARAAANARAARAAADRDVHPPATRNDRNTDRDTRGDAA